MTDLLFIELGAVVAQVLDPNRCKVELFCDPNTVPAYNVAGNLLDVDFTHSLDHVHNETALYDQVASALAGRVMIGPSWPGGGYEGILCVRQDSLKDSELLRAAAAALEGPRCKYQVIASFVPGGPPRRYHGFVAEDLVYSGNTIGFRIGTHTGLVYDPSDPQAPHRFYTGDLVPENLVKLAPGQGPGPVPVFLNVAEFAQLGDDIPKQPPSAGL